MTRDQIEHVIRAAAAIEGVIGALSQFDLMLREKMISLPALEQRIWQLDAAQPIELILTRARRRAAEADA